MRGYNRQIFLDGLLDLLPFPILLTAMQIGTVTRLFNLHLPEVNFICLMFIVRSGHAAVAFYMIDCRINA